jgi:2-oxoglutarate ferredoxin oxidoreductase subunit beta
MQVNKDLLLSPIKPTWCAGCGNFSILSALKQALIELELNIEDVVMVFGIGCSGNMADFIKGYGLHSLHGRGLANAIGIKLANHKLKVIMIGGDGDIYGEGLNHLMAASRGNHDITALVHNNHRYSLTTGQTSPTSHQGTVGKSTPQGVIEKAVNPISTAVAADAGFVARAYLGNLKQTIELIKEAILYEGFSLVDILQPCPSFNKEQDYNWYAKNTKNLELDYDLADQTAALTRANKKDLLELGVFYKNENRKAYHQQLIQLNKKSLVENFPGTVNLKSAVESFI